MNEKIRKISEFIVESDETVVFTGAGVSTESGIPDFRSPGGIWEKYDPNDFRYETFMEDPGKYWKKRLEVREEMGGLGFSQAEPNPAHLAIAGLERLGKVSCVVTQNVDNLHQEAGCSDEKVIELHGNNRLVKCLDCGSRYPSDLAWDKVKGGEIPPTCKCGGLLKTDTILFGEPLPEEAIRRARDAASNCDFMLVVGSSLVVYPAAGIPAMTKRRGSKLGIVNLEATRLDSMADVVINDKAGKILPKILGYVKELETNS